jgi:hypothetical protein
MQLQSIPSLSTISPTFIGRLNKLTVAENIVKAGGPCACTRTSPTLELLQAFALCLPEKQTRTRRCSALTAQLLWSPDFFPGLWISSHPSADHQMRVLVLPNARCLQAQQHQLTRCLSTLAAPARPLAQQDAARAHQQIGLYVLAKRALVWS